MEDVCSGNGIRWAMRNTKGHISIEDGEKGLVYSNNLAEFDLFLSFPISCTDESLSSSFICISVAFADHTTPHGFSSVRSGTLSNCSLVFVLVIPSTIRSLMREFLNVPN